MMNTNSYEDILNSERIPAQDRFFLRAVVTTIHPAHGLPASRFMDQDEVVDRLDEIIAVLDDNMIKCEGVIGCIIGELSVSEACDYHVLAAFTDGINAATWPALMSFKARARKDGASGTTTPAGRLVAAIEAREQARRNLCDVQDLKREYVTCMEEKEEEDMWTEDELMEEMENETREEEEYMWNEYRNQLDHELFGEEGEMCYA